MLTFTYNFQILVTVFGAAFTVFRELRLCLPELHLRFFVSCICVFEAVFRTSITAFMHTRAAFVVQSWCAHSWRSSGNGFRSAVSLLKTCAHKWSAIMEWRICHDEASGCHIGVLSCEVCKSFFRRSIRTSSI